VRRTILSVLLALSSLCAVSPVLGGPLRFWMPDSIVVPRDAVLLSHVLPVAFPNSLRAVASNQPEIPKVVAVRHTGERLNASALLRLFTTLFDSDGSISESDISFPASIVLPSQAGPLRVLRVKPDPLLHAVTVRLAPQNGVSPVPFDVIVRTDHMDPPRTLSVITPAVPCSQTSLVEPRRLATLRITSSQSQMLLLVRPLECGYKGQNLRVRVPKSGKTLRATVIARDSLEALF
jgi:hypothetical protein